MKWDFAVSQRCVEKSSRRLQTSESQGLVSEKSKQVLGEEK